MDARKQGVDLSMNMPCMILFVIQPATPEKMMVHKYTFPCEPTVRTVLQHFGKLLSDCFGS
jgi:hypothetical protein